MIEAISKKKMYVEFWLLRSPSGEYFYFFLPWWALNNNLFGSSHKVKQLNLKFSGCEKSGREITRGISNYLPTHLEHSCLYSRILHVPHFGSHLSAFWKGSGRTCHTFYANWRLNLLRVTSAAGKWHRRGINEHLWRDAKWPKKHKLIFLWQFLFQNINMPFEKESIFTHVKMFTFITMYSNCSRSYK